MSAIPANRDFQLVEGESDRMKYIREGAKTAAATMIWTRNKENVIHTFLSHYSEAERKLFALIPKGADVRSYGAAVQKLGKQECYFSVSLSNANIFFKTDLIGMDIGGFQFQLPTEIYKVQRRIDMRMPIREGYTMKLSFRDPLGGFKRIEKKALDLSAGGLSFKITNDELPIYVAGLQLKAMEFSVRGRKFEVNAEVRHARPEAKELPRIAAQGARVGVKFKNMSEADSQHIAQWVFEESRKFLTRLMK